MENIALRVRKSQPFKAMPKDDTGRKIRNFDTEIME